MFFVVVVVVVVVVVFVVCWLPSSDFFSWCFITRLIGNFISLFFLSSLATVGDDGDDKQPVTRRRQAKRDCA